MSSTSKVSKIPSFWQLALLLLSFVSGYLAVKIYNSADSPYTTVAAHSFENGLYLIPIALLLMAIWRYFRKISHSGTAVVLIFFLFFGVVSCIYILNGILITLGKSNVGHHVQKLLSEY